MRIIAIANHKGGCGKTTTSINFAACLAHLGKKVLLVDLDPQGHSTCGLGIRAETLPHTLYDLFQRPDSDFNRVQISQMLCEINPQFHLVPSYGILSAAEEELVQLEKSDQILKSELIRFYDTSHRFDYIILDCPPNLGLLTRNALQAAHEVMVPIEPSFFSLHGLAKMMESIQQCNQTRNEFIVIHALLTLFDSRTSFSKEVYEEVQAHFKSRLFKTIIHDNVALKEAASAGLSIVDYDKKAIAFQDYLNLAVEYLEREWDRLLPEKKLGWNKVFDQHFGPRPVLGGVLFQALSPNATEVEIAGDFNHWIPEPMVKRTAEGLWQKVIPIVRGKFRYKYIVDGEWQVDPYQPVQRTNDFGTTDSYLEIA